MHPMNLDLDLDLNIAIADTRPVNTLARLALAAILAAGLVAPAHAQDRAAPKPPRDLLGQIGAHLAPQPVANAPCGFNLFGALQANNLLDQIQICVTARGQDDVKAALDSATAAKDQTAIACLTPALAIVQAAAGAAVARSAAHSPAQSPSQSASQSPSQSPSLGDTAPAPTNATAPNAPVPGPILIFQKFREFVLAGGPSACKAWVNTTLAAGNPLTN